MKDPIEILPVDSPDAIEAMQELAAELTRLGLPAREERGWLRVKAAPALRTPEIRARGAGKPYFVWDGFYRPSAASCARLLARFVRGEL